MSLARDVHGLKRLAETVSLKATKGLKLQYLKTKQGEHDLPERYSAGSVLATSVLDCWMLNGRRRDKCGTSEVAAT